MIMVMMLAFLTFRTSVLCVRDSLHSLQGFYYISSYIFTDSQAMSTLRGINSHCQLRGQEQTQRQGQPQCPGQTQLQKQMNSLNKPSISNGFSGLEQRFERLLMTVRSDGQTVHCDEPSTISHQWTERPLGRGAFGEVWWVHSFNCCSVNTCTLSLSPLTTLSVQNVWRNNIIAVYFWRASESQLFIIFDDDDDDHDDEGDNK